MDTVLQDGKIKDVNIYKDVSSQNNSWVYCNSTQNTTELWESWQKDSEVYLDDKTFELMLKFWKKKNGCRETWYKILKHSETITIKKKSASTRIKKDQWENSLGMEHVGYKDLIYGKGSTHIHREEGLFNKWY